MKTKVKYLYVVHVSIFVVLNRFNYLRYRFRGKATNNNIYLGLKVNGNKQLK